MHISASRRLFGFARKREHISGGGDCHNSTASHTHPRCHADKSIADPPPGRARGAALGPLRIDLNSMEILEISAK